MFAAGQSLLSGHSMTLYDASRLPRRTARPSPLGAANSANQQHGPDRRHRRPGQHSASPPTSSTPASRSAPAVARPAGTPAAFPPTASPGATSAAARRCRRATGTTRRLARVSPGGITAGKAIRRTIAPGCPTLLEESDDSNVSSTDFTEVTPAPRNNASAVTEHDLRRRAQHRDRRQAGPALEQRQRRIHLRSPDRDQLRMQARRGRLRRLFEHGPRNTRASTEGSHTFQVRGVNALWARPDPRQLHLDGRHDGAGGDDRHPPRRTRVPATAAAFTFHANETGATFECSLVPTGQPDAFSACVSGKTYPDLANGEYTFEVVPTDLATNAGAAASFSWDSRQLAGRHDTAADDDPLATPRPERQRQRLLHLRIERAGVELRVLPRRRRPSAPAPPTGVAYSGLANGPHSFQVRAIDTSANVDPTPAGYSFSVAVAADVVAAPPPSPAPPAPLARPASGAGDDPHREARRGDPRPHAELPLQLRPRWSQLRMRGRPPVLQALPLPVHDEVAQARAPHRLRCER